MRLSHIARTRDAVSSRVIRSIIPVSALVLVLLVSGMGLTLGARAGADAIARSPASGATTSVSDIGVGISDIPEYFVSPISGASYRIVKDADRGTYLYCAGDGRCVPTREEIMAGEAKGLPAWAVVVEPDLRDRIAAGGSDPTRVIIELRDGTFGRVASEAWARADPALRALETRASAFTAEGVSDRPVLDQINALADATRSDIYARANSELAPLVTEARVTVEGVGGTFGGSTPVLPAVFALVPLDAIPAIAENPWVGRISEDRVVPAVMDVSAYAIHADTWWTNGYTGGPWDLVVEDTGIDATHPAFAPVTIVSRVFHAAGQTSPGYADQPTNPDDLHSHGTHVGGTVASNDATYRGVAYGLRTLINAKAGWLTTGGGGQMIISDGMAGVDWAVGTAGADVISLSFGGPGGAGDTAWERFFDAVIDGLRVSAAIAAGNSGPAARSVGEPGAGMNILSVGAVDDMNTIPRTDDAIASFSSRGPTGDGRLKPDISAPGVSITSTYAFWEGGTHFIAYSGTSMATPHVAASHILLMNGIRSTFPPLYKALLLNSAEDRGTAGGDTAYGWGYIDLRAAYNQRANVREGNVTAGPVHYMFYRGAAAAGDKATLVWNRHSTYNGANYPTTYFPLNDLDLLSYDEAGGNRIGTSTRTVDNVEQVVAAASTPSTVYKVNVPGTLTGVSQEHYAIVLPPNTFSVSPPSLTVTASGPATMEVGTIFTITANVTNGGSLAAQNVQVTLNLPAGLSIVSGTNPMAIGRIAGSMSLGSASWQVAASTLGLKTVTANAASVSYDETFSGMSEPYSVVIVDSVYPVSSVNAMPGYTTSPSFGVTATASDLGGVASVELFYQKDAGGWSTYGVDTAAPWVWTFDTTTAGGDGFYEFYSIATDRASNREAAPAGPDASTSVDTSSPTSAMIALPTYETSRTFDVAATASDLGSGVANVSFYGRRVGGSWALLGTDTAAPWTWTFDSVTAGGDGMYEFYSVATDAIGNREPKTPVVETSTIVDTTPPATAHTLGGIAGSPPWYTSGVTVTLNAFDANGVSWTQYRIDGGAWQAYTSAFLVAGEGTVLVEFSSLDNAGNSEALQGVFLSIDTIAPTTVADLGGARGGGGWFASVVTVTLTPADATSGIASTEVNVDAQGWQTYGSPVTVVTEGSHEVQFRSTDVAGNPEPVQLVQFQVDLTPPTSDKSVSGTVGGGGWYTSPVTVLLTASDSGSQVAGIEYRIDGGAWTPYAGAFVTGTEGAHALDFRATDVAGNAEAPHTFEFRVDTVRPEIAIAGPTSGGTVRATSVELTWTATDSGSGVSSCSVAIDGGTSVSIDTAGSHTFQNVADGSHSATVTCGDVAGNSRTSKVDFSVDTSALGILGTGLWPFLFIALIVSAFFVILVALARRRKKEETVVGPPPAPAAPVSRSLPPPPPVEAPSDPFPLPPPPADDPPAPPLPPPP